MCGRFSLTTTVETLQEHFAITQSFFMRPRYNIAPGQKILIQTKPGMVDFFDWGFTSAWLSEKLSPKPFINARSETILEKPLFRQAVRRRRCLVLADGFYEWKILGRYKQPYYIHRKDRVPFAIAGIYENETVALITTVPNTVISEVHARMPVILPKEQYQSWLNPTLKDLDIAALLQPNLSEIWSLYPVSAAVNKPDFDNIMCLHSLHSE